MNHNCTTNQMIADRLHKKAFTVVELLIVMGIIVLVAAVTLPSVKGLLSGQKVSEASRIVRTYADAAKARAIATGRPVALILDRSRYDGQNGLQTCNMCTRLSMGDVFPPYTGDWLGSKGVVGDASGNGFGDNIVIPFAQAASLFDTTTSPPTPSGMVQAGDLIELGARREKFFITAVPTIISGGNIQIFFNNPSLTTAGVAMVESAWPVGVGGSVGGVAFRVYRKPTKSMAGSVTLPRGTCVDLHFSGFGTTGRQFSSDLVHFPTGVSTTPSYPAPYPESNTNHWNYGPIYLVFNPAGDLEAWYFQDRTFDYANPVQQRGLPTGLVHLLVGRTEQVVESPHVDAVAALVANEDFTTNIMDPENSWVTLNPYTGSVTSSPVQSTTVPADSGISDVVARRVAQARSLATNSISEVTQ